MISLTENKIYKFFTNKFNRIHWDHQKKYKINKLEDEINENY